MMDVDWLRKICLSFPHVTEQMQWGDDLVFKVAGKMFAVAPLVPAKVMLSFKATSDGFAELTEREGIIPAPYMARAQWVALEPEARVPPAELKRLLRTSYDLVVAKLPKKTQASLGR
jgi:predicted DNA-binding protein (MmcQ/YjbR family)